MAKPGFLTPCLAAAALVAACGGGDSNPLGNPSLVDNPQVLGGSRLSFRYFQRCIQPILDKRLPINQDGQVSINTCSSSGCHDTVNGTGGALRLVPAPAPASPASAPATIRASDMYKNFYSSQGEVVIGSPDQSRLINKPLVRNVLHGGGLIFESLDDPNAKEILHWISNPMPQSQDEFSAAGDALFDPVTGNCRFTTP